MTTARRTLTGRWDSRAAGSGHRTGVRSSRSRARCVNRGPRSRTSRGSADSWQTVPPQGASLADDVLDEEATAEEVVALAVRHFPAGLGPAVTGATGQLA
ncbi:DUF6193 family natural product biosynthesis protein [Streptomyces hydrogenans]|uniref:DUF6193 family natural product biosynthesis protein n=1 Tax=Streptomyces hydrogenans TaxID=1873719 RepID=UPI0035D8CC08